MSTIPEIVPLSETISQTAQEGLGVGGQVIAKSEMPEIGHSGETSHPGQEGLGVGGQVIAKSEMPETGHSGETSHPGQEGLGVGGQVIAKSEMPEVGQSDVETSQPVVSGSTSEMSLGAAFHCGLKSEQTGGVHSKGQSSDAATQNPNGLDEMPTAGTKLQSVSEKKSVKVELFEASKYSDWFDAIEKKNCKLLLQLFRKDRSLWVQTGLTGRSVLHVAVMQGCSELVRELHYYDGDLVPCGKNWRTPFEFLWENARDGRLKDASAQDIWLVMEGPSVKIGNQELDDRELSTDRSRDDYIKSHVECTMRVDDEMLSLRDAIHSIADEKDFRMDENDVDFNFENVERKELYVHMACSRLRNVARNVHKKEDWKTSGCDQIVEFIIAIFTDLGGKNLLQKLFDQKDAQGRTVLQILVLCQGDYLCRLMLNRAFEEMLEILPDACVNALDKAGRTLLHWAVAHDGGWAVAALMDSGKARRDVTFQTAYIQNITAFHLSILYDQYPQYDFFLHLKDELKRNFCDFGFGGLNFITSELRVEIGPLLWAIQMGRNKFVKDVMETKEYKELFLNEENVFLGYAAWSGNVEILQLFLQKDDVDKVNIVFDPFEAPPLHLAVEAWAGSAWAGSAWNGFPNS